MAFFLYQNIYVSYPQSLSRMYHYRNAKEKLLSLRMEADYQTNLTCSSWATTPL